MKKTLATGLAILSLAVVPAQAATTHIHIAGFAFSPNTVTVTTGDSVNWDNHDGFNHTVTSDTGAFGAAMPPGSQFTITIVAPGTYAYHCSIHPSMTGSITVTGAAIAPSAPTGATAAPGTAPGTIALSWHAPATIGVSAYRIYRGTSPGAETFYATSTSTSYTDSAANILTTYHYKVSATNSGGESARSNEVCSKPFPWFAALGC